MKEPHSLNIRLFQLLFLAILLLSPNVYAQNAEQNSASQEQTEAEDVKSIESEQLNKEISSEEIKTETPSKAEEEAKPAVEEEATPTEEKEKPQSVVVNGDVVEYIAERNEVQAKGNIEIIYGDTTMTCDSIVVNTQTKDALAEGNVVLASKDGILKGERVSYNFDTMKGKVVDLRFEAKPYYGGGASGERLNESEMRIKQCYFTTCDLDKPHYRMVARRLKIYWGDKLVANNVMFLVGKCPVFYIPKFVQKFNETRPHIRVAFGKDKDWGYFALSAWRYEFNDIVKGRLNLDLRERRGFAWGVTNPYDTGKFGYGVFKSYYTNERKTLTKHWYYDREKEQGLNKPVYKERYMFDLRHKWQINPQTELILEYFKVRDGDFMKDYFERRYEKEMQEKTYLQVLHNFKQYGSLSFYMRKRTNRIFSETEELPTIGYVISSMPLSQEGKLYLSSENYFSNLNQKIAAPSDYSNSESRFDFYNKLTYATKVAFVETSPYVALRETFYDRRLEGGYWPAPRTVFYSGLDLTTKFYRLFKVHSEIFDVTNLRHVIQPSVKFAYNHEPTVSSSHLMGIDGTDSIAASNSVTLELLNKLQTKRIPKGSKKEQSIDILRFDIDTVYNFKTKNGSGGNLSDFMFDLELYPRDWISFESQLKYDHKQAKFTSKSFDVLLTPSPRFSFGAGYRDDQNSNQELTSEMKFKINSKWDFRVYERYRFNSKSLEEQQYTLTRDLHCWALDLSYFIKKYEGHTIYVIFRLKAFPDMTLEFSRGYANPRLQNQGR